MDIIEKYGLEGLVIGALTFVIIGVFHPCFWSIKEVFEQRERVRKGWFPKNPKRKYPF